MSNKNKIHRGETGKKEDERKKKGCRNNQG